MPRQEATVKHLELVLAADVNKAAAWVVLRNVVTRLELVAHWNKRTRLRVKHVLHTHSKSGIFDAGVGDVQVKNRLGIDIHLIAIQIVTYTVLV